jgi:hypothetical protein
MGHLRAALYFWGASFFIGGLLNEPLVFSGASFFIGCLFYPMSEGPESAPQMALVFGDRAPVQYEANLVRYFDPVTPQVFGGRKLLLPLRGT